MAQGDESPHFAGANIEVESEPASAERQAGSPAAGFLVWPLIWAGEPPSELFTSPSSRKPIPPSSLVGELSDIVVQADLPHGLRARVQRDGFVTFDFTAWAPLSPVVDGEAFEAAVAVTQRRAQLANVFLGCLQTSAPTPGTDGLAVSAVTPNLLFPVPTFDDPNASGMTFGDVRMGHVWMARFGSTYGHLAPYSFDYRLARRIVVERELIDDAIDRLRRLLNRPEAEHLLALVDLYVRATAAFTDHDYSAALVGAWTIAETLIQTKWERYLNDRGISGQRKRRLTDSQDVTASLIVEMLSLGDVLPVDLFERMSLVRKARNKWVHELRPVTGLTAAEAITTVEHLLLLVQDLEFRTPKTLSLAT